MTNNLFIIIFSEGKDSKEYFISIIKEIESSQAKAAFCWKIVIIYNKMSIKFIALALLVSLSMCQ